MNLVLPALQHIAARRPYFDIYGGRGADRTLYMGRHWLFGGSHPYRDEDEGRPVPRTWERDPVDAWIGQYIAGRLHYIARADRAPDLHTHPVSFISAVVSGWYKEKLPQRQDQPYADDEHAYRIVHRGVGSIAYRRASDRHTIVEVSPGGCYTVFLMGPKSLDGWGFGTRDGYVDRRDYRGAR